MANVLSSNPKQIDTAGETSAMSNIRIQQLQWVDDNADLAASDVLAFVINGLTVTVKPTAAAVAGIGYQAGPFTRPIFAATFSVTTIANGTLLVWVE